MLNFVRKIVSGPKNRTVQDAYDLDLTYITQNIIAMAFPAAGLQKAYRNSIDDIVNFFKQKHGDHYLIINASNRKYDYEKFNYQVLQYFWTDHQAPPLTTLFELCQKIQSFFQTHKQNVVAVHCNHGKGRTGTAIISYLLYSHKFDIVDDALNFYNKKRFSNSKYAVDQPCQLRYLNFFKEVLQMPFSQISKPLKAYKLSNVNQKGLKQNGMYLRISDTRTQHIIYPSVFLSDNEVKFVRPLIGDIFIEIIENNWSGSKQIVRINYNLFFLKKSYEKYTYEVEFKGKDISMKHYSKQRQTFILKLQFKQFCQCHLSHHDKHQCLCSSKRKLQQTYWDNMIKLIQKNRNRQETTQYKQRRKSQKEQIQKQVLEQIQIEQKYEQQEYRFQNSEHGSENEVEEINNLNINCNNKTKQALEKEIQIIEAKDIKQKQQQKQN